MKKRIVVISLLAGMLFCTAAFSQAYYGQTIIGTWKFDLGSGYMASIEYKADGTFEQKVDQFLIKGTYRITGSKLQTETTGQKTVFTIVSFENKKLTIKRNKDGRTIVYQKQ